MDGLFTVFPIKRKRKIISFSKQKKGNLRSSEQ